jgi:trk system potassium uptake protein TrkA
VLQDGDQLVVAATDEISDRVHAAVESPQGGRS